MENTPTPWKIVENPDDSSGANATSIYGDGGRTYVADVYRGYVGSTHLSREEHKANAYFIVRACNAHDDLLKACEFALWVLTNGLEGNEHDANPHDLVVLREAIAKGRAS